MDFAFVQVAEPLFDDVSVGIQQQVFGAAIDLELLSYIAGDVLLYIQVEKVNLRAVAFL